MKFDKKLSTTEKIRNDFHVLISQTSELICTSDHEYQLEGRSQIKIFSFCFQSISKWCDYTLPVSHKVFVEVIFQKEISLCMAGPWNPEISDPTLYS